MNGCGNAFSGRHGSAAEVICQELVSELGIII
jgi:hypothetical protein